MSSGLLRIVIIFAILVSLSASALAQYESYDKARLGVGLAFERPIDPALSKIKSLWMGVNVDINVMFDRDQRPNGILTFGWFGNQGEVSSATLFPVKATYLKRFGQSESGGGWYVGGGPLICFARYKSIDFDPILRDFVSSDDSGIKPGLGVVLGMEFGSWYAEARFDKVADLERTNGNSVDLSGITLTIGTRLGL